jgi:APA family basic amino acid/polyamine antiporter
MVIIIGAIFGKDQGNNYFMWPVQGLNGVILSLNLLFWTYGGYEGIGVWSEETIDPEKTIPRAALLAICIVGTIYTLMALAILRLDTWQNIGASGAPVVTAVVNTLGPSMRLVFSFIGFCSIFNTLLFGIVGQATRMYGYSREGILPKILSRIHPRTKRPFVAVAVVTVLCIGVQFIGSLAFVSQAGTLAGTFNTVLVCIGLCLLRWKKPDMARPYKAWGPPFVAPILVIFCAVVSLGVVGMLPIAYWTPYAGMYGSGAIIYWFVIRPREGKM